MSNVTDTSRAAYNIIKGLLSLRQKQVMTIFNENTDRSFTNWELTKELQKEDPKTNWTINRVTPRTLELRRMGVLKIVGKRTCKITGNTAYSMEIRWSRVAD